MEVICPRTQLLQEADGHIIISCCNIAPRSVSGRYCVTAEKTERVLTGKVDGGENFPTECCRKGQVGGRDKVPALQFAEGDSGKKGEVRVKGVDFSGIGRRQRLEPPLPCNHFKSLMQISCE